MSLWDMSMVSVNDEFRELGYGCMDWVNIPWKAWIFLNTLWPQWKVPWKVGVLVVELPSFCVLSYFRLTLLWPRAAQSVCCQ
jgi:hypothetical protein